MIQMGKVSGSSILRAVGFGGSKDDVATLRIKFSDGVTLDFVSVPYSVFKGLVTATDKSTYYHKLIYGKFKYRHVPK
jgi:hypothetical protein